MPKYPGISPYDNEKGTLGTAKKRWEKIFVKTIESDTISGMNAEIENLATTAENSVTAAVQAKNAAESAQTAAENAAETAATAAAGIQSVVETDVDATLTIPGVAADAKVTGDWLDAIAKPFTADTSYHGPANEFMQYVEDSAHRFLFGIKRDGTVDWQKGVPKHVREAMTPTIENDEYLYAVLDTEEHVLFAIKKDGTVDWQKGTPKHVVEACNPSIENDEYLYVIKDAEDRVVFGVKKDGSVTWQKGLPKFLEDRLNSDTIESEEYVQITQDAEGKIIEGIKSDGSKVFYPPVEFKGGIKGIDISDQFSFANYEKKAVTSALTTGVPIFYLSGDVSEMTKDNKVNLTYKYENTEGTCTCKWQGSSSSAYPKKNYSIAKMSIAIDVGWGLQKKYVLKANFIDFSHARNIVSAKLWGEIVKTRNPANAHLNVLPNGGAIDGFPVMLVINGKYQGIYTLNIPKDKWMFGMGSGENEVIVTAENRSQTTYFKALTTKEDVLAEQDWALEYIPDEDNPDWAINSLNRVISAAINSTGVNYRETLSPYLDIESAIDYYIFSCLIGNYDGEGRNYILGSYDGTKWFFSAYDLDSTFGNEWHGNGYRPPATTHPTFASFNSLHRVMHLIYTYDKDALKARYAEIRNSVMTESNVLDKFANFMKDIPKALLDEEVKLWPMIPGTNTNNLSQIMNWYKTRLSYTDSEIASL